MFKLLILLFMIKLYACNNIFKWFATCFKQLISFQTLIFLWKLLKGVPWSCKVVTKISEKNFWTKIFEDYFTFHFGGYVGVRVGGYFYPQPFPLFLDNFLVAQEILMQNSSGEHNLVTNILNSKWPPHVTQEHAVDSMRSCEEVLHPVLKDKW